jgi:hypothetical protein
MRYVLWREEIDGWLSARKRTRQVEGIITDAYLMHRHGVDGAEILTLIMPALARAGVDVAPIGFVERKP